MDVSTYLNIIFDFDGVITDSNVLKEKNIKQAASIYCEAQKLDDFMVYFTGNNGVPREKKIRKFFENEEIVQDILERYGTYNAQTLKKADFTHGFKEFLNILSHTDAKLYVLSGGEKEEVQMLLTHWKINNCFESVLGGPQTKFENLEKLDLKGGTVFIGDSRVDYEVAQQFNLDFIFMYGYTQFSNWKEFFNDKSMVHQIEDLSSLKCL